MTNFTAASPLSVFTEDGKYLTALPKDYYATKTYTDKLIQFIDAGRSDGKPFFAYVAHQAPHDPYHLPRDWRNRHVGEYDKGWDALRQELAWPCGSARCANVDLHRAASICMHVQRMAPDVGA